MIERKFSDQEEQSNFRDAGSWSDSIFVLQQTIKKRLAHNMKTHLIY